MARFARTQCTATYMTPSVAGICYFNEATMYMPAFSARGSERMISKRQSAMRGLILRHGADGKAPFQPTVGLLGDWKIAAPIVLVTGLRSKTSLNKRVFFEFA
jgi:hypothetical protein